MNEIEYRLNQLEDRLARLENQNLRLQDRIEIENLMAKHQFYQAAGQGRRIVDELWSQQDDVSIEYGASGVYQELWKVKTFYIKDVLPGCLSVVALASQYLEVSGDGQAAFGLWMSLGTETDAGDLGPFPPRADEQRRLLMSSRTEDGKVYKAEWLWQKVEVRFRRENDSWRICNLHVSEYFRCPFGRDWVRFAAERFATDGMWLESLFESPEPLPPQSHGENLPSAPSTYHWQYAPTAQANAIGYHLPKRN